ncbi:uncharacterized protein troap isoform X2 [Denticeps clupeoides]|uniref:uncharacterized protein troap isoform X2 n=1 Tax=Denticeps clupeoides TaxID=299321 RepID=UPI0010A5495A|nr:uncharacterized protein LOC114798695 isoform X2 [Denticeps clupeoides]
MASAMNILKETQYRLRPTGTLKTQQEQNKTLSNANVSKSSPACHGSKRGLENKDPSVAGRLKGVSRLPVLAKSLQHPTTAEAALGVTQMKWEQRPLLGKEKKKKACTKPLPFSVSQPKPSRALRPRQGDSLDAKTLGASQSFPVNGSACKVQSSLVVSSQVEEAVALDREADHQSREQSRPREDLTKEALKRQLTMESGSNELSSKLGSISLASSVQPGQTPLGQTTPFRSNHTAPQRIPAARNLGTSSQNSNNAADAFSLDPGALCSILQSEGAGLTPLRSACSSGRNTSNFLPQRVSVMKRALRHGVESGTGNASPFTPDPAALRSILQNEGIGAGTVAGANISACPSARTTSVYSAQRVPMTKARMDSRLSSMGPARFGPCHSPAVKWMPQRVPSTRPRSTKKLLSAYRTPVSSGSPWLQGPSSELPASIKDNVVQRLFEDAEKDVDEEQDSPCTDEQATQEQVVKTLNPEAESESHFQKRLEKGEKPSTQGPFVQAAHRASVIVFRSASKQLGDTPARAPGTECLQDSHGTSATPAVTLSVCVDQAVGSEVTFTSAEPLNPVVLCHQRVMALRRRLPALGEMLLDEECSTYTSRPQSGPALPRCPNPIAVTLLFQDSTCFVPIGPGCCTLQSPASFHSSPIRA